MTTGSQPASQPALQSAGDGRLLHPRVSTTACPAETVSVPAPAGSTPAIIRRPPGPGPFPAVVDLHGGLEPHPIERLMFRATSSPLLTRLLAAGYVVVEPTFRDRRQDPLTDDALEDCVAVVQWVKRLPEVDPRSVVVVGGSGGGSLALELAGAARADVCAVAAQEPASVLLTGMYNREMLGKAPPYAASDGMHIMENPRRYFTPAIERRTREKLGRISCPIFIGYGDVHPVNKINNEIVIPLLRELGKALQVQLYPGELHGFPNRPNSPASIKFFEDCHAFFLRYLPTRPQPVDASLVEWVSPPAAEPGGDQERAARRGANRDG